MTALLRHQPADGTPTWWASWAVRSASLPLPSEHRDRYRQEFLAELYGMTPAEQLHHATGIVSRVWALRVSLTDTEPARLMSKEATMAKPLRCRLRLHRWRIEKDYQGQRYRECIRCGAVSGGSSALPGGGFGGYQTAKIIKRGGMPRNHQGQASEPTKSARTESGCRVGSAQKSAWLMKRLRLGSGMPVPVRPDPPPWAWREDDPPTTRATCRPS